MIRARIHHHISVHSQADARWSYVDPPLAQLPNDLEDLYVPDAGWPWLCWDWDQAELRLHACYAKDKPLLEAFAKGWDVHLMSYCQVFGQPYPPQLKDPFHVGHIANKAWLAERKWTVCDHPRQCAKEDARRHFAKTFQHRMCKGGGAKDAANIPQARQLNLDGPSLTRAANAWHASHPAVVTYHRRVGDHVLKTRMSRTFIGRRRVYNSHAGDLVREALAHRDQAAVQDIANLTFLAIKDRYGADVVYKYGKHDSMKWGVRQEKWEEIVPGIKEIVQRDWDVEGTRMPFPASFKEVWA